MLGKTIKHFKDELSLYFDFDFLDCLNNTNSAKFYHTYLAEIKNEHSNLAPDKSSVIIKELSKEQLPVYKTISENWNPHLETVFGIISDNDNPNYALSISEFIDKPSSLDYASLPKDKKITTRFLTLEQYINSFGCLSEKESLILIHQLCDALAVLHKNHMIHGDISPKNVLLTDKFNWDNEFKIFNKIIFPVIIPGVATQAIFTFVGCWNSYVQPSILLFSQEKFTLPILVQQMQGVYKTDYGVVYLGVTLSVVPILLLFMFCSKKILESSMSGAVKG